MYLHGTSQVNVHGHLEIGGVDTVALAKEHGTPLYVYDVEVQFAREPKSLNKPLKKRT